MLIALNFKRKSIFLKKKVAKDVYIDPTVQVLGWKNVSIGNRTIICENCWLNVNSRKDNFNHIEIGDNCYIGRRNFFTSGELIKIGSYCMTSIDCKFLGSSHVFDNPLIPYLVSGTTEKNKIILGTNVCLGAGVTIVGNVKIGYGSIIGAGSIVNKDIPPFTIAIGSPAGIIKKYDFNQLKWIPYSSSAEMTDNGPNEEEYLALLKRNYPEVSMPLQAASRLFGDLL